MKGSVAGRLTMSSLLTPSSLNSSMASGVSQTKSASLTKAEKEIKSLKAENNKLRKDLEDVRSLYNQLVSENSHEKFDERRITLLKSQIIQLERQILLMSEALCSRSSTLMEVENALTWLADKCRQYISLDTRGPNVGVPRGDLTQMVHTAESGRIKLYKTIENCSTQMNGQPLMFMNTFLKTNSAEGCTLLDIASGRLDYLNLKHVTKLESKLASLYKDLIQLHEVLDNKEESSVMTSGSIARVIRDRMSTQLLKSCARLKDCCGDLFNLSLLYPSAPWPPLRKSVVKDVTCDHVMASLPTLPKSKVPEVQRVVASLLKAQSYHHYMLTQQVKALKEELKFHQAVYNLQISYSDTLLSAVRQGYKNFETSTNEFLVKPLREILEAYMVMKTTGSDEGLRNFLSSFKNSEDQLMEAVLKLSLEAKEDKGVGEDVLSQFGEEFTKSLDKAVKQSQWKRDKAGQEIKELREEQKKMDEELRCLLDQQEQSYQDIFLMNNKEKSPIPEHRTHNDKPNLEDGSRDFEEKDNRFVSEQCISSREHSVEQCAKEFSALDLEERTTLHMENSSLDIKCKRSPHHRASPKGGTHTETSPIHSVEKSQEDGAKVLTDIPPKPKKKSKKDQKYIPNTFVPNRTLHLRRAGSLNSLSDHQEPSDTESVNSQSSRGKTPNFLNSSKIHRRSTSRSGHS